ncbi:MAG: HipA N-terminal domain-containing protein [Bacteroidetes bacterium]|jgi:HipA-like protein|nr:HipA N-terminal domain-containing protein [Bacteroidota bacterium]
MREAKVLFKDEEAGVITQHDDGSYTFRYYDVWLADKDKPGISLTLPKNEQQFHSEHLFPFFYNMLPEGSNKQVVCKLNRIDKEDYFGLLMTTAKNDSIGAVRVVKMDN